jgi:glycerol uptake facilitator-like aquaporin
VLLQFLGSGLLAAIVVGADSAAQRLIPDNAGLQLLETSVVIALAVTLLMWIAPLIRAAQFNPAITLALGLLNSGRSISVVVANIAAQVVGAIGGCLLASALAGTPFAWSAEERATVGSVLVELAATAVLVVFIAFPRRPGRRLWIAPVVGVVVGAVCGLTSGTSLANPALTIGRMFTDTSAGVAPVSALWLVGAGLVGAVIGFLALKLVSSVNWRGHI